MKTKAMQMAAAISKNVDDFYAHRITYEAFGAESIRLWDAIKAAGVTDGVLSIQRNKEAATR